MKRVVVTGVGFVSPLGCGSEMVWQRLLNGESGIKTLIKEDELTRSLPISVIAPVPKGHDTGEFDASLIFERKDIAKEISTVSMYAIYASDIALKHAQIGKKFDYELNPERSGVAIASGIGAIEDLIKGERQLSRSYRKLSPYFVPKVLINMAAGQVSLRHNLKGPNHTVSTACAAGAHAIGDAYNFIRLGYADMMVAGGSEACITPLTIAGFSRMKALSLSPSPSLSSRPFHPHRDGFVLGEGAGVVILEELSTARHRGANILCEVVGYGVSGDSFHPTSPCERGEGARRCMQVACQQAGITANEVAYINAHATSTPIGDRVECLAIESFLREERERERDSKGERERERELYVSSTKGATGHLLGAAGAVEAGFLSLACRDRVLPPTLHLDEVDTTVDISFQHLPHRALVLPTLDRNRSNEQSITHTRDRSVVANHTQPLNTTKLISSTPSSPIYALSNSFGFGGTNASLLMKTFQDE